MPLSPLSLCTLIPFSDLLIPGTHFILCLAIGIGHYLLSNYLLRNLRLLKGGQRFQPLSHYANRGYIYRGCFGNTYRCAGVCI